MTYPLIIKNFISNEECSRVIDILDPSVEETPSHGIAVALSYENSKIAREVGITRPVDPSATPEDEHVLSAVFNKVRNKFDETFNHKTALTQGMYQIMVIGGKNDLHSDTTDLNGVPFEVDGKLEEMEWSGILYLNTCGIDFVGGELVFPNQKVVVIPEAGDLVLFPGNFEHVHSVSEVTDGVRKNLIFFYGRDEVVGSEVSFYGREGER